MLKLSGIKAMFLAIFVGSLALSGCGQLSISSQAAAQPVVSTTATDSAAPLLQGTYATQVTGSDLSSKPANYEEYIGNWQIKLGAEGDYSTILNGQVMSQGRYYFVNEQLVFSESRYSSLCPTAENNLAGTSGTYDFSFDGEGLALKAVSENCAQRTFLMQAHPLTLQV
jgi:hypothetical protein